MPSQLNDGGRMQQELTGMIGALELSDFQRQLLLSRWLDQLLWMEGRANAARNWHYRLRLTTIVGGVLLPALVSLDLGSLATNAVARVVTVGISVLVALSAAVEEFFHYGERWRHYRRTVEHLKTEGWQFFQLSGPYREFRSHSDGHAQFAARVEDLLRQDIDQFVTTVARDQRAEPKSKTTGPKAEGGGSHGLS